MGNKPKFKSRTEQATEFDKQNQTDKQPGVNPPKTGTQSVLESAINKEYADWILKDAKDHGVDINDPRFQAMLPSTWYENGIFKDHGITSNVKKVQSSSKTTGAYGTQDWWTGKFKDDFIRRHKNIIDEYKKETGKDWDPTVRDYDKGTRSSAMDWFEKRYHEKALAAGRPVYSFGDHGKYGEHSWSAPSTMDYEAPKPPETEKKDEITSPPPPDTNHITGQGRNTPAPWWLQDEVNLMGAVGNYANIKKYPPWQAQPAFHTPDFLFVDPTRELAANEEQQKMAGDMLSKFTGPQAFNSRMSDINARGAGNAADILSRYNNQNVGIYNQKQSQESADINNFNMQKAAADTSLYDKYTVMNQNFDNSRTQAKDAMLHAFVQGVTNANYTQGLNSINPRFQVDAPVGGRIRWNGTHPDLDAKVDTPFDLNARVKQLMENSYIKAAVDKDPASLWKYIPEMNSSKSKNQLEDPDMEMLREQFRNQRQPQG